MSLEVMGRVCVSGSDKGVYGATVELVIGDERSSSLTRRVITNRAGEFHFYVKASNEDVREPNQVGPLSLRVMDSSGKALGSHDVAFSPHEQRPLDVVINVDELLRAKLPDQPQQDWLLTGSVFEVISQAIDQFSPPKHLESHKASLTRISSELPPILTAQDLLDLAQGVLDGHPDDQQSFIAELQVFEAWNQQSHRHVRDRMKTEEAEALLEDEFLTRLSERAGKGAIDDRATVIPLRPAVVLLTAAMHAASDDPRQIHRNIGILMDQLCGIERLDQLRGYAEDALSGYAVDQHRFLAVLDLLGGGVPPADLPVRPEGGRSLRLPCPGERHWPPGPDDPTPSFPGFPAECMPEAIRAIHDALRRTTAYSVSDISPSRACPGDIITITGTNFVFEGHTGIVLFPGLASRTNVPATPTSWTDTEITVVVPDGAVCGTLELDIPVGASIIVCDVEVDLFESPSAPIEFMGGETVIRSLATSLGASGNCLRPGDELRLTWSICNADHVRITITDEAGGVVHDETLAKERRRYRYSPPVLGRNTRRTVRFLIDGPCGEDVRSLDFAVRRGTPLTDAQRMEFAPRAFANFHGNVNRDAVPTATPSNLNELVRAVQTAEDDGRRLGVMGSRCSYTDCIVPRPATTDYVIDMDGLDRWLNVSRDDLPTDWRPAPDGSTIPADVKRPRDFGPQEGDEPLAFLSDALRSEIRSVLPSDVLEEFQDVVGPLLPVPRRLAYVQAGIKVGELNCLLDHLETRRALPTMGAGVHQSISGAFSTGTHGGTLRLPPLADFVRALHLIGPGGQQWWIEPASNPITDPVRMAALRSRPRPPRPAPYSWEPPLGTGLDPCIKIVYDDDLFFSTLVSFGSAGLIYAVVLEAVNAHNIQSTTVSATWAEAQGFIRSHVIEPATPRLWFFEVTVNPTRHCRVTTKRLTNAPPSTDPANTDSDLGDALQHYLFGPLGTVGPVLSGLGAIGALLGAVPFYVARRATEIALLFARLPITPFWEWDTVRRELEAISEEIEVIHELVDAIRDVIRVLSTHGDRAAIADSLPNLLNLIGHIGFYITEGQDIIDTAQNIYTNNNVPLQTDRVSKSYTSLTSQKDGHPDYPPRDKSYPPPPELGYTYDPFERQIHSSEYCVPANRCIEFVDSLLGKADEIRSGRDALILAINIRFTRPTRALIGMQQFARCGHVEVFTARDLNGNESLYRHLDELADRMVAAPHWGQVHSSRMDFPRIFGRRLDRWRAAMTRVAVESEGDPNTFRHNFALDRGLLSEL